MLITCSDFTRAVDTYALAARKQSIVKSAVKSSFDIFFKSCVKSSFDIYFKRSYTDPIAA